MTTRAFTILRTLAAGCAAALSAAGWLAVRGGASPAAMPPAPTASIAAPAMPASPPWEPDEAPREPEAAPPEPGFLGVLLAERSLDVAPAHEGRLAAVHVRLGDAVEAGDRLATIDMPMLRADLAMARAAARAADMERDKARVALAEAREMRALRERLVAAGVESKEQLARARYQEKLAAAAVRAAGALAGERRAHVDKLRGQQAEAEIRAPFSGLVAAQYADPGVNVTPSTPILRLISGGDLLVRFAIPEEALPRAPIGGPVRVTARGATLEGVIEKVAPEVDAASRLVVAEARIDTAGAPDAPDTADAPEARLLAGETARVQLPGGAP